MKDTKKTLLVVDDEAGHRQMVRAVLEDVGWTVCEAENGDAALETLLHKTVHTALVDMRMPGMDGMSLLKKIHAHTPQLPVVLLTAYGSVGRAVEAMKMGAFDYLTKPADNEELKTVLNKSYDYYRLLKENAKLKQDIKAKSHTLIGTSPAMVQVRELIEQAGASEATVLITGNSGTGKELVAEGLHAASNRAAHSLIKVNCAALPENLLESELFGYVKGAFTGAVKDKPGRFTLAHKGTLFLDEIGEMPSNVQAKLLRALQEKTVEPLGSIAELPVDVRIVAATNRNLQKEVAQGNFREDLYYRLAVLEINIPPLRERLADIPLLLSFLLRKLGDKNNTHIRTVTPAFLDALYAYDWPGNVRELENVLERALILSRADELYPELLPPQILQMQETLQAQENLQTQDTLQAQEVLDTAQVLGSAEKKALVETLNRFAGHREKTADALGISRRTLQYKLKKYGLIKR